MTKNNYDRDWLYGLRQLIRSCFPYNHVSFYTYIDRNCSCRLCSSRWYLFSFADRDYVKRCKICGCFLYPKTLLKNERCPLGKWYAESK